MHVPALRAAGFDVVALVGRDADRTRRRAERLDIPVSSADLPAVLDRDDITAVTVATPPAMHAPVVVAAAQAGKHLLCEKPFARDTAEAVAMLDAAAAAGVTHLVGHEFRFAPERAVIGRAIAGGMLGELRFLSLVQFVPLVADPETRTPPWWFDPEAGGGWLGASGSHVVDQVRVWGGEFAEVSARLGVVSARESAAEDSFTTRFRLANGADGVIQQTAAAWGPLAGLTRVAGSRATAWIDGTDAWIADADGTRPLTIPPDLALPAPPPASDDPRHQFTHLELGPFTRLCEVLRAGVEARPFEPAVPVATFVDGVATTRVLDAIRASANGRGETIHL